MSDAVQANPTQIVIDFLSALVKGYENPEQTHKEAITVPLPAKVGLDINSGHYLGYIVGYRHQYIERIVTDLKESMLLGDVVNVALATNVLHVDETLERIANGETFIPIMTTTYNGVHLINCLKLDGEYIIASMFNNDECIESRAAKAWLTRQGLTSKGFYTGA